MLRKLEKYEIIEEIGHGGMATVYRARDSRLDRPVALKVMHPHLRSAREARARFVREARSVARLHHPNILEIYDNSEEDSEEAFIVTELLTGPTLKQFAESHPGMPAEIAACFTIELARALVAAHGAGIVHRDVKPENVLLHEDRCVKLTDFGIAQMIDAQSFTATGQILGSPGHMAPEQVEGGECDARTDVFSLGTVLYFLATGRLPFVGRNPHQILKHVVDGDYPDPLRVCPAIGARLSSVITKALQKDPAERHQTAQSLQTELEAFLGELGIEDPKRTLERYLKDHEGASKELRAQVVQRLTELGRRAADDSRMPVALDHFNRVLALDEGNETVLGLIDKIGRRSRRRMGLQVAGAVLGVLGVTGIGVAVFAPEDGGPGPDDDPVILPLARDARGTPDAAPDGARALRDASGLLDAGRRPDRGPSQVSSTVVRPAAAPRLVVFRPDPPSVSIGVDDRPPVEFGPAFRSIELLPGPHTVRLAGACCVDRTLTVTVPPGVDPFVLQATLDFEASLIVRSHRGEESVHGDVVVGAGQARGRANSVIMINLGRTRQLTLPITVTATGYRAYTGEVRLSAGELATMAVELEEASGSQP